MNVNDCGSWQLCPNPLHHSAASSTPFLRLLLVAGKVSQKQRRKEEKGGKQTKGRQATLMDSHAVGLGAGTTDTHAAYHATTPATESAQRQPGV